MPKVSNQLSYMWLKLVSSIATMESPALKQNWRQWELQQRLSQPLSCRILRDSSMFAAWSCITALFPTHKNKYPTRWYVVCWVCNVGFEGPYVSWWEPPMQLPVLACCNFFLVRSCLQGVIHLMNFEVATSTHIPSSDVCLGFFVAFSLVWYLRGWVFSRWSCK